MSDVFESTISQNEYENIISDLGIENHILEERLKKAEKLLEEIKNTNSHHQIKEKIDDYKKPYNDEEDVQLGASIVKSNDEVSGVFMVDGEIKDVDYFKELLKMDDNQLADLDMSLYDRRKKGK
jgi:hypothetical protein|tara:strand:- start:2557 stop:2928 length:372 start_codon:yes stop_codon:yes gene_type:complete